MKQQLPALGVWLGRIPSLLLSVVVLGTLCAPALIQLTGQSTDTSFLDNSPPARMPKLPTSIDGMEPFRNGVIKFIDDNFGLRAEMVRLNVLMQASIGVSSVPSLMMGKDGWFFLKTHNDILDQFRGLNRFTDNELEAWIDTMELYQRWLEQQGIAFTVVVAPNQQTIYPEYMPMYANRVWPETRLDQLSRRLLERNSKLALVDPRRDMWAARQHFLLYHKYENHWNALGSFVGYTATMQQIQRAFPTLKALELSDFTLQTAPRSWPIPPLTEIETFLTPKFPSNIQATESLGMINGQAIVKTVARLNDVPSLLLFGDSFAVGLMPYFNETFKSTIAVPITEWPFANEYIKKYRPNLVIYELAERFLSLPIFIGNIVSDLLRQEAPPLSDAIAQSSGVIGGYIDGVGQAAGMVEFTGWATDTAANAPAKMIFAYYGDRVVGAAKPSDLRGDITPGMTDHKAGFRISVPRDLNLRDPSQRLRFFSTNPSHKIYEIMIYAPVLPRIEEIFKRRVTN
jgi:alginate O-acetyltransferase complex protein AlgJ